jgi:hypothetical protein
VKAPKPPIGLEDQKPGRRFLSLAEPDGNLVALVEVSQSSKARAPVATTAPGVAPGSGHRGGERLGPRRGETAKSGTPLAAPGPRVQPSAPDNLKQKGIRRDIMGGSQVLKPTSHIDLTERPCRSLGLTQGDDGTHERQTTGRARLTPREPIRRALLLKRRN